MRALEAVERSVVLLLDGDAARREATAALLRGRGCWVVAVCSADEAIAMLTRIRPSLLIAIAPADPLLMAHLHATRALAGLRLVLVAAPVSPAVLAAAMDRYNAPARP